MRRIRTANRAVVACLALGLAPVLVGLVARASRAASAWENVDARSLGAAGITLLDRLDRSPGAPLEPGFRIEVGTARPFLGSGLAATSARVQLVRRTWGAALGSWQLQSDVHRENETVLAMQIGRGTWRWGASTAVYAVHFPGYPTRHRLHARLGVGVAPHPRARLVAAFEHRQAGRILVAARLRPREWLDVSAQYAREPALPGRLRLGVEWSHDVLLLRSGYDAATRSSSVGLCVEGHRWLLSWATRTHPDLGWGYAWTLALLR